MLIFLVMCLAAILPTGFSDPSMGPQQMTKNEEMARRYAAALAAARNLGIYVPTGKIGNGGNEVNQETVVTLPGTYVDGRGNEIYLGNEPDSRSFWVFFPAIVSTVSSVYKMIRNHRRSLDYLEEDAPRDTMLDSIGGGHLLKRVPALDSIGGGHLLKRAPILDQIGGGHLLKRDRTEQFRQFLLSGNEGKRSPVVDPLGGGHLLKRFAEFKDLAPSSRQEDKEFPDKKIPQDNL